MNSSFKVLVFSLLITTSVITANKPSSDSRLIDLDESAQIIIELIHNNKFSGMLENSDPRVVATLVKNFSPAELALEAEVLNWPMPVVIWFANSESDPYKKMKQAIGHVAEIFSQQIKFVEIDVTKIYSIAQNARISVTPTLMMVYNRQEVERIEGVSEQDELIEAIYEFLATCKQEEERER